MSVRDEMSEHYQPSELAGYFDGTVRPADTDAIEEHLGSCADCRSHIAAMSGARRAVQLLPMHDVPDEVWGRIEGRLQASPPATSRAAARPPRRRGAPAVNRNRGARSTSRSAPQSASPAQPSNGVAGWQVGSLVGVLIALVVVLVFSPLGNRIAEAVQPPPVGINYGDYLKGLSHEPSMERFETAYGRQRLPIHAPARIASVLVGRDLLDRPPAGLVPRTAYTLSDDGIRATQVTYVLDRSLINVFRQPADHPARFEDMTPRPLEYEGVQARVMETDGHRAVTFAVGPDRYVLIVGKESVDVRGLVDAFVSVGGARPAN